MAEIDDVLNAAFASLGARNKQGGTLAPPNQAANYEQTRQQVTRTAAEMLGLPDAMRALQGEMSPTEQKDFAITAAMGLIPGSRMENLFLKGFGRATKAVAPEALATLGKVVSSDPAKFPGLMRQFAAKAKEGDVPEAFASTKAPGGHAVGPWFSDAAKNWEMAGGQLHDPKEFLADHLANLPQYEAQPIFAKLSPSEQSEIVGKINDKYNHGMPFDWLWQHFGAEKPKEGYSLSSEAKNPLDKLTSDYHAWAEKEGLPSMSMDELDTAHANEGILSGAQHKQLQKFIAQYDLAASKDLTEMSGPIKPGYTPASEFHQATPAKEYNFSPLDWNALTNPYAKKTYGDVVPPHAIEAGFNPAFPLYKGGNYSPGEYPSAIPNPMNKGYEKGFFLADKPSIAATYGGVTPYLARAENPLAIDWKEATGNHYYSGTDMHRIIEAARQKGADFLQLRGLTDQGGAGQNQYVVLNPALLRAPTAKFDPARLKENAPLASLLAALGLGGGASALAWDAKQHGGDESE